MELSDITIEQLKGNQRELAETIGIDAYIKLVKRYGGDDVYVAKEDKLLASVRDEDIYLNFDGSNGADLGRKHKIATRTVYRIYERERQKRAVTQMSLFDEDAQNC